MSQSVVVTLLAERPREELQGLVDEARATQRRLAVELEQLEAAQVLQSRREGAANARGRKGETRQLVLKAVADHIGPISPAEIIARITANAPEPPTKGAIRNMISRLTDDGDLKRIGEGAYQLPSAGYASGHPASPNGLEPSGEEREGMGLRMAAG